MVVAGELKDRRAECRTLQSEVALLKDTNDAMHDQIMQLEARGMDLNKSSTETYNELNGLKGQLMDKEKELQAAKDAIALEAQKGEEALSAYKRKAQQSLSLANSRTASAVQAKEDAEMEARAARSSADSAMERATTAERKGIDALAEAKAYVSEMKEQVAKLDEIKKELMSTKAELERIQSETSVAKETVEKQSFELQSLHGRLEAEQMTTRELKIELSQANDRSAELLEEMERLRREGKRLKEDLQRKSEESTSTNSNVAVGATEMVPTKRSAEAEATIAMLQQALDDANQAIRELKETLKTTVEYESRGTDTAPSNGGSRDSTSGMPLFYAMEKQAELTQARNEIARLAALVGNSEASKQEAFDDMHEMRRQLEELQSKLQRESRHSTPQEERVNLEYLKHVILSFLNAKSHLEKKTLLPVIGAVLCLTPQEQQQTMQQLDQEGKLYLESVTSSVLNLKWS
jgi:chromosome segregation ATPase